MHMFHSLRNGCGSRWSFSKERIDDVSPVEGALVISQLPISLKKDTPNRWYTAVIVGAALLGCGGGRDGGSSFPTSGPPSVISLSVSAKTDTSLSLVLTGNSSGTAYVLALAANAPAPLSNAIQASGVPVEIIADRTASIDIAGLHPSYSYVVYAFYSNADGTEKTSVRSVSAQTGRNPLRWPFSTESIWNMPIGSGAEFVHANLPAVPGSGTPNWTDMPAADAEFIFLDPTAPLTPIYENTSGWTVGGNRCYRSPATNSTVLAWVPMAKNYVVDGMNTMNAGAAFLLQDGNTLLHAQPIARCNAGEPAAALLTFPIQESLYGNGITGAHGGSQLSTIGGTLRVGELRPNGLPPRHALKIDIDSETLFAPCATDSQCFRWPARVADSGATSTYGKRAPPGVSTAMKMGALLAIPGTLDIQSLGLETDAARLLAWTLQNYGAYIVDSSGGPGYNIATEEGPNGSFLAQFEADWKFKFAGRVFFNTPWVRDIQRLFSNLHVVSNNGPESIGGGGTPRQPLAVPFSSH